MSTYLWCNATFDSNIKRRNAEGLSRYTTGQLQAPTSKVLTVGRSSWRYAWNLCERYEIQYIEQEESYTSKSSFLDNDVLPEYNPEQPYKGKFSGKRIYRGLYQSANGTKINADVNGAATF